MKRKYDRQIILEDGSWYCGYGFGDMHDKILEKWSVIRKSSPTLPTQTRPLL